MRIDFSDTICAISTPLGKSGIGIVRISGKESLKIAERIFLSKGGGKPSEFKTYTTHYGWIVKNQPAFAKASAGCPPKRSEGGQKSPPKADQPLAEKIKNQKLEIIDEVILTVMCAPKSYTKEDIVEINCHGGIVPLRKTLELVLENGGRLAEPGEFTQRAFLSGRIDLAQAEAVLDIVQAKTEKALKIGLRQLRGELSSKIDEIRQKLIEILANLEVDIDFPIEEITTFTEEEIIKRLDSLMGEIKNLISSSEKAKILRDGISLVICGKPNVGKSSLLNCLLKEERAIVTPLAGTTRDTIEETIDIKGIPFKITDTAGILEPRDLIERKAIERSRKVIEEADLILMLFDGSLPVSDEDLFLLKRVKRKSFIPVINKIDLKQEFDLGRLKFNTIIKVSALKRIGIENLEEEVIKKVFKGEVDLSEEILVSNIRHIDSLKRSKEALERMKKNILIGLSNEFLVIDLKEAIDCLGEITGKVIGEDLWDKIFSEFCIGK